MTNILSVLADAAVAPDPFFTFGVLLIVIPLLVGLVGGAVVGLIFLIRRANKKNRVQTDYRGVSYGTPPYQDRNTDHRS